jgi:thiol-disulfide isomerase/thioredoxin
VRGPWRWVLVVVVLAVAAVIALWPRGDQSPDSAVPTPPAPDLVSLRAAAQLSACPKPAPGGGRLAGIKVTCMADGSQVTLGGGPMLVNFWEPWCVPCRTELPLLAQYAGKAGAVPVLLVEIPAQSDEGSGLGTLGDLGIHLPSVYDQNSSVANALGKPNVFPVSYVVAADGTAHRGTTPAVFDSVDQVEQAVRQYANGGVAG